MERLCGHTLVIFAARPLWRNDILTGISDGYTRVFAIFHAIIATNHSMKNTSSTIITEDITIMHQRLASNNSKRNVSVIYPTQCALQTLKKVQFEKSDILMKLLHSKQFKFVSIALFFIHFQPAVQCCCGYMMTKNALLSISCTAFE